MVMKSLRDGASGGITKFILVGFLVLAGGGLIFMDVGNFFRGGVSGNDAAKVGNSTIGIVAFDQVVRQNLRRVGIPPEEAYRLGYIEQLLGSEIRTRMLQQSARNAGLLVGHKQVAEKVKQLIEPYTQQGANPKEVLENILFSKGMSESQFTNGMARDMAAGLLTDTISSGFMATSPDIARDIYNYRHEKRSFEYITFLNKDITDIPDTPEENLREFYEKTKEVFSSPEYRTFQLLKIKRDALESKLEISEEEIRQTYEDNIDLYHVEEQRTLDQALISSQDNAEKIAEKVKAGSSLEKAVKDVTSSTTSYLGEKAFTEKEILEELKEPVLSASKGDIIGPVETPLGWQVIVLKNIQPAETKSFDSMKGEIREELMGNLLIDQLYALANTMDDLLASGMGVDELAEEIDLEVTRLPAVNQYGQDKDDKDGLKNHEQNRIAILETGFKLLKNETSAVMEMQDGSFMAIHLETLTPKSYKPFEEVRDDIAKRWKNDQKRVSNKIQVTQRLQDILSSGVSLKEYASKNGLNVKTKNNLSRDDEPQAPFTQITISNIFEAGPGQPLLVDIEDGVALAVVTDYEWPENPSETELQELTGALTRDSKQEGLQSFLFVQHQKLNPSINRKLLDRTYGADAQGF